jgi:hypothetical protein
MSRFSDIIDRAREEGKAKLKIIAPDFTPPKQAPIPSGGGSSRRSGGGSSRRSGGGSSGGSSSPLPQSTIQTPTPAATAPQPPAPSSSGPSATQQRAILASQTTTANQRFIQTATGTSTPQQAQQVVQSRNAERAAAATARRERFRIGLSESEKRQSTGQVIKGRAKEVGTGIAKAGIGIAEGSVNLFSQLGVQTIEPGQSFSDRKKFKFGGKLGEIRDTPATTGSILGQAQVLLPALGAGGAGFVSTARTAGLKVASIETAAAFSPLKIRPGSFGALETQSQVSKLKFDVVSVKTQKGGVTTKQIFGSAKGDPSVQIKATQISKGFGSKEVGKTITTIQAPRTTFRAGEFDTGIRAIRTETAFVGAKGAPSLQSKAFGVSLKGLQGGGAVGRTRTIADIRISSKEISADLSPFAKVKPITTGGLTQRGAKFDVFATGPGSKVVRISPTSRSELIRVRDISARGVEFDLSKISSSAGFKFTSSTPKGAPSLGLKQTTAAPVIARPSVSIPSIKQVGSSPALAALGVGRVQQPFKQIPKQAAAPQSLFQPPKQSQPQSTLQTPTQGLIGATSTKNEQKLISVPNVRSGSRSRTIQTPIVDTIQIPDQIPRSGLIPKVPQIQQPRFAQPITPGINLGRPTPTPEKIPFSFALPKIPKAQGPQRGFGNVGLEVRRGGKFFGLGRFNQAVAFSKGKKIVTGTLAATFRLPGATGITKAPKGFRIKQTSFGPLFIEKRGRRLSTGSETLEIRTAKAKKKKKSRGKKR